MDMTRVLTTEEMERLYKELENIKFRRENPFELENGTVEEPEDDKFAKHMHWLGVSESLLRRYKEFEGVANATLVDNYVTFLGNVEGLLEEGEALGIRNYQSLLVAVSELAYIVQSMKLQQLEQMGYWGTDERVATVNEEVVVEALQEEGM